MRHKGATLTAVADVRPEILQRFSHDVPAQVHATPEELCASLEIDVVYVATPTHLHTEHVLLAIANGKHVLVAKPMAVDLANAEIMVDAAARAGVALVEAHPQTMEQPVLGMRSIVESGKLGQLRMVHNWHYGSWLYQPRLPEELDTELGGGATFRQGAHQFDILRLIGGGQVRSVRAMTGIWDPTRPTEGAHVAYLDFEDGTVATAVFSGYDHFSSSELTYGLGQGGTVESGEYGAARKARADSAGNETELKKLRGYGASITTARGNSKHHQPAYGLTIVSCDFGDIRQSQDGLLVYGTDAKREVALSARRTGHDAVIDEVVDAVTGKAPAIHGGAWSLATLELTLAVLQSSRNRAEVYLKRQVPLPRRVTEF